MKPIVTRFAPSPTGFMHIGGVRTALFAWLWARKNSGTFLLRIEDTDKEREVAGSIEHIQESLSWLGLNWDFGPDKPAPFGSLIQSQRLETYKAAAQTLIEKGLAYPDPYSPEEIESFRQKAQEAKRPFLFRDHRPETFGVWDGTTPLRLKVPEIRRMIWDDAVRGELEAGEEALDDFILIKSDGYPTYNFAHIVDDHNMGVTHVMRGDEFISSTPKFLSLYEALGYERPVFATLPPILREDKTKKLGKRDGAKDLLEYRTEGFLPEAMVNYLSLLGWNPGGDRELFDLDGLVEHFSLEHIQKSGAVFNEEKLRWFNREYLLLMPESEFASAALSVLKEAMEGKGTWDDSIAAKIAPLLRERTSIWQDIRDLAAAGEFDFFFAEPTIDPAALPGKNADAATAAEHLAKVHDVFAAQSDEIFADPERLKNTVWDYATEKGRGSVLWPLRFSLSGRERSPEPFLIASIIGKERTLKRIEAARALLI